MDLKEVSQRFIQQTVEKPFSLVPCADMIAIVENKNWWILIQPSYKIDAIDEFNFNMEQLNAPIEKSSTDIIKKETTKKVFSTAGTFERQFLTLDPIYAVHFSDNIQETIISASMPPKNTFPIPVCAVVSNCGACNIVRKMYSKEWDYTLIYINKEFNYNIPEGIEDINTLRKSVEDYCISTCCWSDFVRKPNEGQLYCTTLSGWIISLRIKPWTVNVSSTVETNLYKINCIRAFSFTFNNKCRKFLLVSNVKGAFKMFEDKEDKIDMFSSLWGKEDNMPCREFICQLYKEQSLLIATSKGAHFFAFVTDLDGAILSKISHYVGNIQITGLAEYRHLECIICTITGYVEHIKIVFNENDISLRTSRIPCDYDCENYQVLGMVPTKCKVTWIFALYSTKVIDLKSHNYCMLSVCALNSIDPLEKIKALESYSVKDYADCAEVIRLKVSKRGDMNSLISFNPEPVQINDGFLHRLRIRSIIVEALLANKKLGQFGENSWEVESKHIRTTIRTVFAFMRINYLASLEKFSNFQKLAMTAFRKVLINYLKDDDLNKSSQIKQILIPVIENLLEETSKLGEQVENCLYCGNEISIDSEMCVENHRIPRCCISFVQVLFTTRHCPNCSVLAHDDDCLLKEILKPNENPKCLFCNCLLVKTEEFS